MDVGIDLLGGFAVRVDGREVPMRGDYPRAILARLALSAGEVVATDDLIDDVWARRPDHVLSTLRAHVSRVRTAALGAALVGDRRGYVLDIAPESVDLSALRARRDAVVDAPASPERLSALLPLTAPLGREALPGLERHPFVPRLRRDVADEHRILEEELGEAALAVGDAGLAVAVLTSTVERHPLHERPARLLATAFARSSRQAEAVDVLDAFRTRLGDRGGLRVSARVEALRASIVRLDPDVVSGAASRGVVRAGIPIPLTRLLGRDRELADLRRRAHTDRLITLVGPAGVGKTRLAVESARQESTATTDEQYLVDLADVDDPAVVPAVIAAAVRAAEPTIAAVARRMGDGRVLLLIDNADRVIGALAVSLDALMAATTRLRVLVTSREPLRIASEQAIRVAPLSQGPGGAPETDAAWQLFAERAADARGGRPIATDDIEAARELCATLDGIPLAIELAAARLDVLGVAEVRAGVGRAIAGPGRHGSVRAALEWSVELLDAADRSHLTALARFAGPLTVEAVSGVCELSPRAAQGVLDRLTGKSLVSEERDATGRTRYRVLESLREYLAATDEPGAATAWRDRHRRWFAEEAMRLGPDLRTFTARDAMAMLDGFRADLTAALSESVAAGDRETAVRLVAPQAHYWFLRGSMLEARRRLDTALALPGEPDDRVEALAQLELANLAYQTGDAPAAFDAVASALAQASAAGDATVATVALSRAGYGRSLFGDAPAGEALLAEAARLLDRAEPWARSEYAMAMGQMRRAQGRADDALLAATEAHRIAASIGYTWMITSARYVMAKALVDARRPREAVAVARSAIAGAWAAEDPSGALAIVHTVAGACASLERHEAGARLLGAVDTIGLRYDYSTHTAEGAEAQRVRDGIAAGLRSTDFEREYRAGTRLAWDDVVAIVDLLPRAHAESPLLEA